MITNRKELKFYVAADRIMRGRKAFPGIKEWLKEYLWQDPILRYQVSMRKVAYFKNCMGKKKYLIPGYYKHLKRYKSMGIKLGFSIGYNCFGYGLVIPHYGTIVVGDNIRAGNYCVLHTSTCIEGGEKKIGNGFYMGTGVIVTGRILLGDHVSVAANSLVTNEDKGDSDILLVGSPAKIRKEHYPSWYIRDGYHEMIQRIESLKSAMGLKIK